MSRSTTEHRHDWIGLDIGGANIKAAHVDGTARTVPFEVWKRPDDLTTGDRVDRRDLAAQPVRGRDDDGRAMRLLPHQAGRRPRDPRRRHRGPFRTDPSAVWGMDGRFHSVDGDPRASASSRPRPTGSPWRRSPPG